MAKKVYRVYGLEYLGRKVVIRGKEGPVEAKRFVILAELDHMPTEREVIEIAKKSGKNIKKVWVMEAEGNKWRKVLPPGKGSIPVE